MGSFVHCNVQYLYLYFLMFCLWITVMTLPLVGPLLDNKNSYSYTVYICWYWWNCWLSLFKLSFHNWNPMGTPIIQKFVFLRDFWHFVFQFHPQLKIYHVLCFIIFISRGYLNITILRTEVWNIMLLWCETWCQKLRTMCSNFDFTPTVILIPH
jgi:hypothetical protein